MVCLCGLLPAVNAAFTATTSAATNLTSLNLNTLLPGTASATRVDTGTCRVTWDNSNGGALAADLRYDVTGDSGVAASGVAGNSADITASPGTVATVKVRYRSWVSSAAVSANACAAAPGAPVALTLTPADAKLTAQWQAAAGNGATVTSYTATISPAPESGSDTCVTSGLTCTWNNLLNGGTYTVKVTATSAAGTGPAATAQAVPFPAVLASTANKVWLDAQTTSTLSAAADCSGSGVSSGAQVSCWRNRTGNGWNAKAGSSPPRLSAGAINGRAAVKFSEASLQRFEINSSGIGTVGSNNRSIFAVAQGRPLANDHPGAIAMWPGYHSGLELELENTADAIGASAIGWTSGYTKLVGWTGAPGASVMAAVSSSSSGNVQQSLAVNSGTPVGQSATGPWGSFPDVLRIGSMTDQTSDYALPLEGDIGEIIVLNRAVTAAEQKAVEQYLARKWGVTLG